MYSTYRKIVWMYLCTYAYIQCVYYLVLIRWPWRKGLSNSLSLSSPRLHCLASGLQNITMRHSFSEVATVLFHLHNFTKKNLFLYRLPTLKTLKIVLFISSGEPYSGMILFHDSNSWFKSSRGWKWSGDLPKILIYPSFAPVSV